MGLIKKYKSVIVVVLPILILVLFRSFGTDHFKTDAKKWAETSILRSNVINMEQTGLLQGEKLILNLGGKDSSNNYISKYAINLPADSILIRKNLKTIRKHKGPVLLYSTEPAVAARIWMVLSQMGYQKIYILTDNTDNEIFKYKFRPDSIIKPEL